jgi:hypothetical protein
VEVPVAGAPTSGSGAPIGSPTTDGGVKVNDVERSDMRVSDKQTMLSAGEAL